MKNKIIEYIKNESGQTSTEYILLVAVAAAIVIKFKGEITDRLIGPDGVLGKVMGKVTNDIENWD